MKRLNLKIKRAIALISDTHVGSVYSVFPDNFTNDQGNRFVLNHGQHKLLEYWEDFKKRIEEWHCDTVIHVGDLLDGTNRAEYGESLMTTELETQLDAAEVLLKPMIQHRKFAIVSGSGYHESLDVKIHKSMARRARAYCDTSKFLGVMANIKLKDVEKTINISHKVGSSIYNTAAMDKEAFLMSQATALGKLPKVDIIIRGHIHKFNHIHLAKQHMIQVPAWKVYQPNRIFVTNYGRWQPDIGGVIMLFDEKNRLHVLHYLYPLVHIGDNMQNL